MAVNTPIKLQISSPKAFKTSQTVATLTAYTESCLLSDNSQLDVVEICGGEGGVLRLAARKHLRTGQNFDLRTGSDLTKKSDVDKLWLYLAKYKPRVIVGAPPCTAFGQWAHINKIRAPASGM